MLFNSIHFLLFLPIVVAAYYAIPHRYRWALLLGASYYFYMSWNAKYAILIIASTVVDYFAGLAMARAAPGVKRRLLLGCSLLANLGLLFSFKYLEFAASVIDDALGLFNLSIGMPNLDILLPVGISFYTFQTLSYTIDVYRGERDAERHFGVFALYVSFFPQLVAGPIERSTRLLPQLHARHRFDATRTVKGLQLIAWGLFKKVVIADRVAVVVDAMYADPATHSGPAMILATVFFAFQIYCDFSAYSDIAIGSAELLGVNLMQNFRQPYFARSIGEFWQRWHISLSTWFRDYVYLPLGGNRVVRSRWVFNILVTFLVSGLWHGANWTFIVWGGLNGLYLIAERMLGPGTYRAATAVGLTRFRPVWDGINVARTFALTCFAWVFFRAESLGDAMVVLSGLGEGLGHFVVSVFTLDFSVVRALVHETGVGRTQMLIAVLGIAVLLVVQMAQVRGATRDNLLRLPIGLRWAAYYALVIGSLALGAFNNSKSFIYFQF